MNAMYMGHRKRLKERFLREGLQNFGDAQVLELLLFFALPRQDTSPIAHALLQRFGSLSAVMDARAEDLLEVGGIGESAVVLLKLAPGLLGRYLESSRDPGAILLTTHQCGEYLLSHFFGARDEMIYLLCLDAKCKVLACRKLHQGSVNTAAVSVRKVVEAAISANATSVVLAHNHTSGLALPSEADKETTRALFYALKAVDVLLADHIVVAGDDFVSLADDGFFRDLR